MAPDSSDQKAKTFTPQSDMAALYIYRNENYGFAIPMEYP